MTYSEEKERILAQAAALAHDLPGYRDTKDKDDWYEGPMTRMEYFKAFWKDQWDRSSQLVMGPLMLLCALLVGMEIIMIDQLVFKPRQDTRGCDLACMRSCKSLDGLMVEQTRYGCTCRLHKGGKKVLR